MCGAMHEKKSRALPIARNPPEPKHAHMSNWDSMRKELKHYRPWLRKGIPDLAYGISAHYSRFGLRDIGTLFPI